MSMCYFERCIILFLTAGLREFYQELEIYAALSTGKPSPLADLPVIRRLCRVAEAMVAG